MSDDDDGMPPLLEGELGAAAAASQAQLADPLSGSAAAAFPTLEVDGEDDEDDEAPQPPPRTAVQDEGTRKRQYRRKAREAARQAQEDLERRIAEAMATAKPEDEEDWLELIDDVPNEQVMAEVRRLAQETHVLRAQERNRRRTGATAAAVALNSADAVIVVAGSGMSIQSGLPDIASSYTFRSRSGDSFVEFAQSSAFSGTEERARKAWGMWAQLLDLYSNTKPHEGFTAVKQWCRRARLGSFVYTSQFDGQFAGAGYDTKRLVEAAGSIHRLQCSTPCGGPAGTWTTPEGLFRKLDVGADSGMARGELPRCPDCSAVARPNVRMFDDDAWVSKPFDDSRDSYDSWLRSLPEDAKLVVVEIGVSASSGLRVAGPFGQYEDSTALAGDLDLLEVAENLLLGFGSGAVIRIRSAKGTVPDGEDYRLVNVKGSSVAVGIERVATRMKKVAAHQAENADMPLFSDIEGGTNA